MTIVQSTSAPAPPPPEAPALASKPVPSRLSLCFELLVVFWFYLLPTILGVIYRLAAHVPVGGRPGSFAYTHVYILIEGVGCLLLLLFIIHRSGQGWAAFGFVRPRWWRDALLILAMPPVALAISWSLWRLAQWTTPADTYEAMRQQTGFAVRAVLPAPLGAGQVALAAASCLMIGFREELLMRSYLISRLEHLTGSTAVAVTVSVTLFGIFHVYQGPVGVVVTALMGLVLSLIYCRTRRLLPVALGHAAIDFTSLVIFH